MAVFWGVCSFFWTQKNERSSSEKRYMKPVRIIFVGLVCGVVSTAHADIASVQWVRSIISAIEPPAQTQVDWNQADTTADDYIKNKPSIPSTAADVGAVAATQSTLGGILTTNATTGAVEVSSTIAESKVANLTTDLAAKQDAQIGAAGDAGKAVIVANDGTMTMSTNTLGSAAYENVASSITQNGTGLVTSAQVYDVQTTLEQYIEDETAGLASAGHTHPSSKISAMTGYSKPNSTSAITASDSLNAAIGKLEKALDNKVNTAQGNGNANKAVITDASGNITTGTITSTMITDGTIMDADVNASAAISTGKSALPTGWTNGDSSAALVAGDTVSVALGKLEKQIAGKQASGSYVPTTTTVNNKALSSSITLDGADVALTGYTKPGSTSAVAASDTINAAIGKLEAALDGKQASGSYVPTTTTVNSKALSSSITLNGADVALTGYTKPGSTSAVSASDTINTAIGKLEAGILPVGTTSGTVAAGDDARFDSIPTTQPSGTPPTGRVWVWFN